MNEKELVENRNEKVTRMEEIMNTAKAEKRLPTDAETTEFENLEKEVKNIDKTLAMNDTINKMELKEVPTDKVKELTQEEKDIKTFANIINEM